MKKLFFVKIPPDPLRVVLSTRDVHSFNTGRPGGWRWHYLKCGHEVVTKQSRGFPKRMRCRDCSQAEIQKLLREPLP